MNNKEKTKAFDPEGSGYDDNSANRLGYSRNDDPSGRGHLPSLDHQTGMVLKGRGHDTWHLMVAEEDSLGNKIIKKDDGRYYSVPKAMPVKISEFEEKLKLVNASDDPQQTIADYVADGSMVIDINDDGDEQLYDALTHKKEVRLEMNVWKIPTELVPEETHPFNEPHPAPILKNIMESGFQGLVDEFETLPKVKEEFDASIYTLPADQQEVLGTEEVKDRNLTVFETNINELNEALWRGVAHSAQLVDNVDRAWTNYLGLPNNDVMPMLVEYANATADNLDENSIKGEDVASKITQQLIEGTGMMLWDFPQIVGLATVTGPAALPIFMGARATAEALGDDRNTAREVALKGMYGTVEGLVLHRTFAYLSFFPKSTAMSTGLMLGALPAISAEMAKPGDLGEKDFSAGIAQGLLFASLAGMQGEGKTFMQEIRDSFKVQKFKHVTQATLIAAVTKAFPRQIKEANIFMKKQIERETRLATLDEDAAQSRARLSSQVKAYQKKKNELREKLKKEEDPAEIEKLQETLDEAGISDLAERTRIVHSTVVRIFGSAQDPEFTALRRAIIPITEDRPMNRNELNKLNDAIVRVYKEKKKAGTLPDIKNLSPEEFEIVFSRKSDPVVQEALNVIKVKEAEEATRTAEAKKAGVSEEASKPEPQDARLKELSDEVEKSRARLSERENKLKKRQEEGGATETALTTLELTVKTAKSFLKRDQAKLAEAQKEVKEAPESGGEAVDLPTVKLTEKQTESIKELKELKDLAEFDAETGEVRVVDREGLSAKLDKEIKTLEVSAKKHRSDLEKHQKVQKENEKLVKASEDTKPVTLEEPKLTQADAEKLAAMERVMGVSGGDAKPESASAKKTREAQEAMSKRHSSKGNKRAVNKEGLKASAGILKARSALGDINAEIRSLKGVKKKVEGIKETKAEATDKAIGREDQLAVLEGKIKDLKKSKEERLEAIEDAKDVISEIEDEIAELPKGEQPSEALLLEKADKEVFVKKANNALKAEQKKLEDQLDYRNEIKDFSGAVEKQKAQLKERLPDLVKQAFDENNGPRFRKVKEYLFGTENTKQLNLEQLIELVDHLELRRFEEVRMKLLQEEAFKVTGEDLTFMFQQFRERGDPLDKREITGSDRFKFRRALGMKLGRSVATEMGAMFGEESMLYRKLIADRYDAESVYLRLSHMAREDFDLITREVFEANNIKYSKNQMESYIKQTHKYNLGKDEIERELSNGNLLYVALLHKDPVRWKNLTKLKKKKPPPGQNAELAHKGFYFPGDETRIRMRMKDYVKILKQVEYDPVLSGLADAYSREFTHGRLQQEFYKYWVRTGQRRIPSVERNLPRVHVRGEGGIDPDADPGNTEHGLFAASFGFRNTIGDISLVKSVRSNTRRAIYMEDAFIRIPNTNKLTAKLIGKHEVAAKARYIMQQPEFRDVTNDYIVDSKAYRVKWQENLADWQGIGTKRPSKITKAFNKALRKVGVAVLGNNESVMLAQFPSIFLAMNELSADVMFDVMPKIMFNKQFREETLKRALEVPEFKERFLKTAQTLTDIDSQMGINPANYYDPQVKGFIQRHAEFAKHNLTGQPFRGENSLKTQAGRDKFMSLMIDAGFGGIEAMDRNVHLGIFLAAESEGFALGLKGDALKHYTSARAAKVMYDTQPTWDATSASQLMLDGRTDFFARVLSVYGSQRLKTVNIVDRGFGRYQASKLANDGKATPKAKQDLTRTLLTTATSIACITLLKTAYYKALKGGEPEPNEAEFVEEYIKEFYSVALGNLPLGNIYAALTLQAYSQLRGTPETKTETFERAVGSKFNPFSAALRASNNALAASYELFNEEVYETGQFEGEDKADIALGKMAENVAKAATMLSGRGIPASRLITLTTTIPAIKKLMPWQAEPNAFFWQIMEDGIAQDDQDKIDFAYSELLDRALDGSGNVEQFLKAVDRKYLEDTDEPKGIAKVFEKKIEFKTLEEEALERTQIEQDKRVKFISAAEARKE